MKLDNLATNLISNINHAFNEYYSENVDLRIHCKKNGLAWKCPELKAGFDGKILSVDGTRIRFDLWGYAYQGYQHLAEFIDTCWHDPQAVIDEFVIAGIFDISRFRMKLRSSYNYEALTSSNPDLDPKNWNVGSIVTLDRGIFAPKASGDFSVNAPCYEVRPFFSKDSKNYKNEIYMPPCTFVVSAVDYEEEWFDSYGDMYKEVSLSGAGTIKGE